jgi:hypothetical protein
MKFRGYIANFEKNIPFEKIFRLRVHWVPRKGLGSSGKNFRKTFEKLTKFKTKIK